MQSQDNCFVKGSHKYDIYLVEENKIHLNSPIEIWNLPVLDLKETPFFYMPTSERFAAHSPRVGFEGRIWDLIVSVPDHGLSFYFVSTGEKTE